MYPTLENRGVFYKDLTDAYVKVMIEAKKRTSADWVEQWGPVVLLCVMMARIKPIDRLMLLAIAPTHTFQDLLAQIETYYVSQLQHQLGLRQFDYTGDPQILELHKGTKEPYPVELLAFYDHICHVVYRKTPEQGYRKVPELFIHPHLRLEPHEVLPPYSDYATLLKDTYSEQRKIDDIPPSIVKRLKLPPARTPVRPGEDNGEERASPDEVERFLPKFTSARTRTMRQQIPNEVPNAETRLRNFPETISLGREPRPDRRGNYREIRRKIEPVFREDLQVFVPEDKVACDKVRQRYFRYAGDTNHGMGLLNYASGPGDQAGKLPPGQYCDFEYCGLPYVAYSRSQRSDRNPTVPFAGFNPGVDDTQPVQIQSERERRQRFQETQDRHRERLTQQVKETNQISREARKLLPELNMEEVVKHFAWPNFWCGRRAQKMLHIDAYTRVEFIRRAQDPCTTVNFQHQVLEDLEPMCTKNGRKQKLSKWILVGPTGDQRWEHHHYYSYDQDAYTKEKAEGIMFTNLLCHPRMCSTPLVATSRAHLLELIGLMFRTRPIGGHMDTPYVFAFDIGGFQIKPSMCPDEWQTKIIEVGKQYFGTPERSYRRSVLHSVHEISRRNSYRQIAWLDVGTLLVWER